MTLSNYQFDYVIRRMTIGPCQMEVPPSRDEKDETEQLMLAMDKLGGALMCRIEELERDLKRYGDALEQTNSWWAVVPATPSSSGVPE